MDKNTLDIIQASITAVQKGSKLRNHYRNFIQMNNVMRAFIVHYDIELRFKTQQEALLVVLLNVEARKNRQYLITEINVLIESLKAYDEIISSATEEQLNEMVLFVESNSTDCKYIVTHAKSLKSSRK